MYQSKTRVMVVDADKSASQSLGTSLTRLEDFDSFTFATSINAAEELLEKDTPDMLFVAQSLPDGSAYDFIDHIRMQNAGMFIVVVINDYSSAAKDVYLHGENEVLAYPYNQYNIDKVVKHYRMTTGIQQERARITPQNSCDHYALMTASNEYRVVNLSDIGFFRYDGKRKQWLAVLNDNVPLALRKGTKATDVLALGSMFQQSHQSFIVNLSHVLFVGNTQVRLAKPFNVHQIPMGRTFLRAFQNRFTMI